jgi:hypothetical protein
LNHLHGELGNEFLHLHFLAQVHHHIIELAGELAQLVFAARLDADFQIAAADFTGGVRELMNLVYHSLREEVNHPHRNDNYQGRVSKNEFFGFVKRLGKKAFGKADTSIAQRDFALFVGQKNRVIVFENLVVFVNGDRFFLEELGHFLRA